MKAWRLVLALMPPALIMVMTCPLIGWAQDVTFPVWFTISADDDVKQDLQSCLHRRLGELPDTRVVPPPSPDDPAFVSFIESNPAGVYIISVIVQEVGDAGYAGSVLVTNYYADNLQPNTWQDAMVGHWLMSAKDVPELCTWTVGGFEETLAPYRKLFQ